MANRRIEIWLPVAIVLADQISKALVRSAVPLNSSIPIVRGLLDFTHVQNSGMSYGFLDQVDFPFKTLVIACFATAALVGVGFYSASLAHQQIVARVGLALIIGGAAGNLIDRLIMGSVVDFVDVYWGAHHFWAFNVADSAITIGVIVMIVDMLGAGAHASKVV